VSRSRDFLAGQPTWLQKALQYDYTLFSAEENREWANNQAEEYQRRQEYEQILKLERAEWNKYCRKAGKFNDRAGTLQSQLTVPKGLPGAPSKDDLAREALVLRRRGMNKVQIAAELNKKHGKNTNTPGSVDKLLKRHFPDKI